MEKLFTILYSFISSDLGLEGLAKEVFAIIFGFWLDANRTKAWVSLKTMGAITGGSRPAIIEAIKLLERKGHIAIDRSHGKHSLYSVTIDADIMKGFDATYSAEVVRSLNHLGVKQPNHHRLSRLTGSSKVTEPVNKNNKHGKQSIITGNREEFEKPDRI